MRNVTHRADCFALAVLLLVCLASATQAGPPPEPEPALMMKDSSAVVATAIEPDRLTVRPGESFTVQIDLDIDEKWHLYAHEDTVFYGIDLTFAEDCPLQEVTVAYPAGEEAKFFGEQVVILHGKQRISLTAALADSCRDNQSVTMELAVQACDDKLCLAPAFIPLQLDLDVHGRNP